MSDRVTRREFAAGLLGSIAATHLSRSGAAAEAANPEAANPDKVKPSLFGGIAVGVQSYTFRAYKLDKMIEDWTEVFVDDGKLTQ